MAFVEYSNVGYAAMAMTNLQGSTVISHHRRGGMGIRIEYSKSPGAGARSSSSSHPQPMMSGASLMPMGAGGASLEATLAMFPPDQQEIIRGLSSGPILLIP